MLCQSSVEDAIKAVANAASAPTAEKTARHGCQLMRDLKCSISAVICSVLGSCLARERVAHHAEQNRLGQ
jgi:hypothetical protein